MLLLLALPVGLLAQAPPQPPIADLKSYLNLQDAQIQAFQQLRQTQMQATQGIHTEMASKQQALREQLDRGSTDAAALGKLLLEIEGLRKRLLQASETYRAQAVNILTAEQKSKLAALEQAQKLEPAVRQAQMLGLLLPPEPGPQPAPGMPGLGRGFGRFPGQWAPNVAPSDRGAMRMRAPRVFPPLPR